MNTERYNTWIEISRNAIKRDIQIIKSLLSPETALLAVVKSNAYGHGLIGTSKIFLKYGADWLGVFSHGEALELRKSGVKEPILVMGPTRMDEIRGALRNNLSIAVSRADNIKHLPKGLKFHLKVDTGLSRQGFLWDKADEVFSELANYSIKPEGLFTHLADAQSLGSAYSQMQFDRFKAVIRSAHEHGFDIRLKHMLSADGLLTFPLGEFDMVRAGIALYGLPICAKWQKKFDSLGFLPALSWKARISEVKEIARGSYVGYDLTEKVKRDTRVAVIPIGYWDGYDRGLSSVADILVHGLRCKILGRVAMNMVVIDVTNVPQARAGDVCTLIGSDGREEVSATELAKLADTINYEIVTRINPLIKRFYV